MEVKLLSSFFNPSVGYVSRLGFSFDDDCTPMNVLNTFRRWALSTTRAPRVVGVRLDDVVNPLYRGPNYREDLMDLATALRGVVLRSDAQEGVYSLDKELSGSVSAGDVLGGTLDPNYPGHELLHLAIKTPVRIDLLVSSTEFTDPVVEYDSTQFYVVNRCCCPCSRVNIEQELGSEREYILTVETREDTPIGVLVEGFVDYVGSFLGVLRAFDPAPTPVTDSTGLKELGVSQQSLCHLNGQGIFNVSQLTPQLDLSSLSSDSRLVVLDLLKRSPTGTNNT